MSGLVWPELRRTAKLAREISSSLRAIHNRLMGVEADDVKIGELRAGILPHLEHAAKQIASSNADQLKLSYWEMQMACELALKMLAQQRSGDFTQTHDLFILYDRITGDAPGFKRDQLKKLPNWEVMVDMRYGIGSPVSFEEAFAVYRATLKIVQGAVASLRALNLTLWRIKIQAPPWLRKS